MSAGHHRYVSTDRRVSINTLPIKVSKLDDLIAEEQDKVKAKKETE